MTVYTISNKYCNSLTNYSRYKTREVYIGDVPLGADNPIRLQSMTTTDTMDTKGTVEQSIRMVEAGAEYVRITAPSLREARNLEEIKKELRSRGYSTPLIADIHFTPNAAELAARIVEKVRVNPGNYADKKKFQVIEYTDAQYNAEIERLHEKFVPLVRICKEYGTAMRIGTNHGSLSDRIMSRYGDTPLGMVESALEFLRICEDENYYDIVLSMKASNPQVMVQAYRLLVNKMEEEGMNYPLHLGVTEAGEGEDGRIKSAMGIGSLLEDGLGDTVRVSLTEDPEEEIPVARELVNRYQSREGHKETPPVVSNSFNPFEYQKRVSFAVDKIGGDHVPVVVADLSEASVLEPESLKDVGYSYSKLLDKWNISDAAADYVYLGDNHISFNLPGTLQQVVNYRYWLGLDKREAFLPYLTAEEWLKGSYFSAKLNFIEVELNGLQPFFLESAKKANNIVLVLKTDNEHAMPELRRAFIKLQDENLGHPVIIKRKYRGISSQQSLLYASTDAGALLIDGYGDGIMLSVIGAPIDFVNRKAFGILQASRTRISKTEYISCPSCGRTLFDLQDTTAMIRKRTNHLKGVKIGIMGCIVNGPGEMADADYGYVGSGVGKITLYRGKEVVKRGINAKVAVDELIGLIKEDDRWTEPAE